MSILGSIFSKKNSFKGNSQASTPEQSDNIVSSKEIDTPFGKATMVTQRYPENPPYDMSDEPEIVQLSRVAVWRYNTRQSPDSLVNALISLFNYGREHGGRVLLDLAPSDCMTVGMAYELFSLYIKDDSRLVNFVSAENALFCLTKSFWDDHDSRSACLLFSLLYGPADLLQDQFVTAEIETCKNIGYPIGMVFMGRNPYRDPGLQGFRDNSVRKRLVVARYLLDYFYNCDTRSVKGASDFFYLLPNSATIEKFLNDYDDFAKNGIDYKPQGEKILKTLFDQVEKTLYEY